MGSAAVRLASADLSNTHCGSRAPLQGRSPCAGQLSMQMAWKARQFTRSAATSLKVGRLPSSSDRDGFVSDSIDRLGAMTYDMTNSNLLQILAPLAHRGWTRCVAEDVCADAVVSELSRLGDLLGMRATGRAGALEEVIRPQAVDDAHPRSLSARYGLGTLPLHIELCHRPHPCRYLLLGCVDPGSPSTATMLLDWQTIAFSSDDLNLLEDAPVLVRTGRHSFYSTILPPNRAFLRYDPGCIEAVNERGQGALRLVEHRLATGSPEIHRWRRGEILVIDNWRVLHGRWLSEEGSGRRLARILIDA